MIKPLQGLKMLDLTRVLAGPFCGMVLADLGVETIKVEIPDKGDDARNFPPFVNDESAYFMSVNRNKKGITLDLKSEEGKKVFFDLLDQVDIVLENFRPGTMEKLGLGYDVLNIRNPGIIYAACSGYGHSGPYMYRPAYDMIVQAMGGIMSITGPDKQHPYRVGSSVGDIIAGLYTAIGILAAVQYKNVTGEGQMVDVAMLDCQFAILENAIARYVVTGKDPEPIGNKHPSIAPFGVFESKDGQIVIAAGNDILFVLLCKLIGGSELIEDERFITNEVRAKNNDLLKTALNGYFNKKTTKEWIDLLNEAGVPCGPINKISDIMADPQIQAREMIIETMNIKGDKLKMPGNPIKMSKSTGEYIKAAPLLGEHNDEILKEFLKYSEDQIKRLRRKGIIS